MLLGVLVLALAGCLVVGGLAARSARTEASRAQAQAADGDLDAALASARSAAGHAATADAALGAPPVRWLGWLPWVGDDLRALGDVAHATRLVLDGTAVPLLEVAQQVGVAQQDAEPGTIDLVSLQEATPQVQRAAESSARARDVVDGIETGQLLSVLHDPLVEAVDAVIDVDETTQATARGLAVAPGALGADGPRRYLLAFQNLAESRPTGGIVGAWGLVVVDGGRITLESTGTNDDIENLENPPRELPEEVTALYGPGMGLSQNVNLSPHFPQAAELLSDLWVAQGRDRPDGVIALTPVALSRLLEATGPATLPDGEQLDAGSVVDLVQVTAYERFADDDLARQAYLGAVTAAAFDAITKARPGDTAVREALGASVDDGHLQVFAEDVDVQAALESVDAAGVLPPGQESSEVRVQLTNADASKLDHYLRVAMTSRCDGGPVVETRFTAPDVPQDLPVYVQNKLEGQDPRSHRVIVGLMLPPTRGLDELLVGGASVPVQLGTERGWSVVRFPVDVPAGGEVVVTAALSGDAQAPRLVGQPMTVSPQVDDDAGRCDR